MAGVAEASKVVIDPDGDLHLAVGPSNPVTFVVCSKTVARASPVWKKLLYGGFAESIRPDRASGKEWIVKLPEDDPKATEILLNIIHCRFRQIPTQATVCADEDSPQPNHINLLGIYRLTVLTDKYDLTENLRPWAQNWVKQITEKFSLDRKLPSQWEPGAELLSWIAWELGDSDLLEKAAGYLSRYYVANPADGLRVDLKDATASPIFPPGGLFSHVLEPAGLSGLVESWRLQAIKDLLEPIDDAINILLHQPLRSSTGNLCAHSRPVPKQEILNCEAAMLGVLIRSLSDQDLWPLPKPEEVTISLVQLVHKLRDINSHSCLPNHRNCFALRISEDIISDILTDSPWLTESHRQHLRTQAEKSGLH